MATLYGDSTVQIIQNGGGGDNWQIEVFTVQAVPANQYNLAGAPKLDDDNDPLLVVKLNGVSATIGSDYTISSSTITWISNISLEQNDIIEVLYQKS